MTRDSKIGQEVTLEMERHTKQKAGSRKMPLGRRRQGSKREAIQKRMLMIPALMGPEMCDLKLGGAYTDEPVGIQE